MVAYPAFRASPKREIPPRLEICCYAQAADVFDSGGIAGCFERLHDRPLVVRSRRPMCSPVRLWMLLAQLPRSAGTVLPKTRALLRSRPGGGMLRPRGPNAMLCSGSAICTTVHTASHSAVYPAMRSAVLPADRMLRPVCDKHNGDVAADAVGAHDRHGRYAWSHDDRTRVLPIDDQIAGRACEGHSRAPSGGLRLAVSPQPSATAAQR